MIVLNDFALESRNRWPKSKCKSLYYTVTESFYKFADNFFFKKKRVSLIFVWIQSIIIIITLKKKNQIHVFVHFYYRPPLFSLSTRPLTSILI